jgi:hypothetical protein
VRCDWLSGGASGWLRATGETDQHDGRYDAGGCPRRLLWVVQLDTKSTRAAQLARLLRALPSTGIVGTRTAHVWCEIGNSE